MQNRQMTKSKIVQKWRDLTKLLNSYSGGAVPFDSFTLFENVKPKDNVLYHTENYPEGKIVVMWIDKNENNCSKREKIK